MPWIKVNRDFTFRHKPNFMTDYKRGREYRVTTRCAQWAIDAGHATYTELEIARRKEAGSDDSSG